MHRPAIRGRSYLRRPSSTTNGCSPASADVDSLPAPPRNATTEDDDGTRRCPRPPARCTERGAPLVALSGAGRAPSTLTAPAASGVGTRRFETVPDTAMKPRPLGCGSGPAVAVAAAAGCAGWAWKPRPRGSERAPGVSPKCSHSASAAAAGAAHSEERRREVLYRPVELPGTGYGPEVEARIERVIYDCRFMTFLGIGGLLLGSVPCFLKGSVHVMNAFVDYYLHGGGQLILMLLEAIELFLIGTVTFVLGIGLYELFISTIDSSYGSNLFGLFSLPDRPKWVEIKSLDDLKTKLGHVIVLVLLVGIFEKSKRVTITSCADLLCLAGSIFLSSVCLYLLSKLNTTK